MWSNPGFVGDFLRGFFAILDRIGYFFLGGIYNIFFLIASSKIFQGDVIDEFYSRVQLILGILMIFKLSFTLLQIIVNPDMFKDKQKGAGSLIKRIALMLVMLSLIVPIEGIPEDDANPLNIQIRNNGVLFGFLYQFQNSVLEDNVLGKLVLGSNIETTSSSGANGLELNNMANVGELITADIAKAFIRPTLKADTNEDDIVDEESYKNAVVCKDTDEAMPYFGNPTSSTLLDHINDTCDTDNGEVYVFEYTGFGGVICAVVMTIIIIGFTLDIAVRAIKLAILRLIAPVPIISYISPGQEKDGAFGNWVKTLTSTYLSLFIRLIIIYFGIYLIIILREGSLISWVGGPNFVIEKLANIFIIIGILVFMKDAPKFFQDMLGIKGDGKLFSGIGTMLGAAALTGGLAGSAIGSYRTGIDEARELGLSRGQAVKRGLIAGAGGVLGGAFVGAKTLATTDKQVPSAVFAAMQKRNATRASGSTLIGRTKSRASALFMGSSLGARESTKAQLFGEAAKAARAHKQMLEDEALKSMTEVGTYGGVTAIDDNGNEIKVNGKTVGLTGNYQNIVSELQQARAQGSDTVTINGYKFRAASIDANVLEKLKESQTNNYAASDAARNNAKVRGTAQEAVYAFNKVGLDIDPYLYKSDDPENKSNVKRAIGEAMNAERDIKTNPKLQYKIADDKATNNNNK